jgi:hypothetical protein
MRKLQPRAPKNQRIRGLRGTGLGRWGAAWGWVCLLGCQPPLSFPPPASISPGAGLPATSPTIAVAPSPARSLHRVPELAQRPSRNDLWQFSAPVRDWKYLVIHHTATNSGNVEVIDAAHRQKKDRQGNPWLGIGYHFVIGNGNGMDDGAIESTFRWRGQMPGAHAGSAEHNSSGIGICLVGNFEEAAPTRAQLAAVHRLTQALADRYSLSGRDVIGHSDVKSTACPGKLFPLAEIQSAITHRQSQTRQQMVEAAAFRPAQESMTP